MTKENILRHLNLILEIDLNTLKRFDTPHEALENEIEALKEAIKFIEQEPNEDCISREKLDKALYERFHEEDSPNNITDVHLGEVRSFIRSFPSTPKTGHWILTIEDWNKWTCSECGFTKRTDIHSRLGYDFCPKCGTKMEGEKYDI